MEMDSKFLVNFRSTILCTRGRQCLDSLADHMHLSSSFLLFALIRISTLPCPCVSNYLTKAKFIFSSPYQEES